jgi:carbonic anhydrase/acetyltransferase-like protein (isoleucine patch superfamily)
MKKIENLLNRIIERVNINLRAFSIDVSPYFSTLVPMDKMIEFYAFYGIWSNHPIHLHFSKSNIAGSYFLGRIKVDNSILYKCDIRGDELKEEGGTLTAEGITIKMEEAEFIWIEDSYLVKTLVHNYSHNPEKPELFLIKRTASAPYANIHGSPVEGCFLEPFCTVDLTSLHDCRVGAYTYLQVGELSHEVVEPGKVWIRNKDVFDFQYGFPKDVLDKRYIAFRPGRGAMGMFMDFAEDRKTRFQKVFESVRLEAPVKEIPPGSSINRYSVWEGKNTIGRNVLVSQRAFLESAWLGDGANAQENCYIANSRLEGYDVTAHGASIMYARLGKKVFVGFNSFLRGGEDRLITIGGNSIVMPHTIMDLTEPITIPENHIVWGYIRKQEDLKEHSLSLEKFAKITGEIVIGNMKFKGSGSAMVNAFRHRIDHILEANGAFFNGKERKGHAQKGQDISFNIIQPYPQGELKGLFPSIDIEP